MKSCIYILVLLCCAHILTGQTYTMQTINISQCHVSAQIPASHTTFVDTLGLKIYSSLTDDSLIGAQLFIYDQYSLDSNDVIADYMQQYNEMDTLKTIAKFMVANSAGSLVYFQISENNPLSKSMDIGIKYADQNTNFISFSRIVLKGHRMVILNVFSQECYLSQLLLARDVCYNGLLCY